MPSASSSVYFQVADDVDGLLWVHGATEALHLGDTRAVQFALDLTPETAAEDAEALVTLLRRHVKQVRLWTAENDGEEPAVPVLTDVVPRSGIAQKRTGQRRS